MNEIPEPTLQYTRLAAEQVRLANHAAYDAPRGDTSNLYDRTGAVHELLSRTEQLVQVLGEQVQRVISAEGLRAADGRSPDRKAANAAAHLLAAGNAVRSACGHVNDAWSELSPLYIDAPEEGGTDE